MRVETHVLGRTVRTLAAPSQMELQTELHVIVEIAVSLTRVAKVEIGSPTVQIPIQILNQSGNRFKTKPTAGQVFQRSALFLEGFPRGNHIQITKRSAMPIPVIAKRVSQKIQAGADLLQIDNPRLLTIEFQSHPAFQFRFDELGD